MHPDQYLGDDWRDGIVEAVAETNLHLVCAGVRLPDSTSPELERRARRADFRNRNSDTRRAQTNFC